MKAFWLLSDQVMNLPGSVEHVISIPQRKLVSLLSYLESKIPLGMWAQHRSVWRLICRRTERFISHISQYLWNTPFHCHKAVQELPNLKAPQYNINAVRICLSLTRARWWVHVVQSTKKLVFVHVSGALDGYSGRFWDRYPRWVLNPRSSCLNLYSDGATGMWSHLASLALIVF